MQQSDSSPHRDSFAHDALKLISGTTATQLIVLFAAPFISRTYTPEAFGILALFLSLSAIPKILACLRYEMAIPLPDDRNHATSLLALCLFCTLFVSLITCLFFTGMSEHISRFLREPGLQTFFVFIPFAVLLAGSQNAFHMWNNRRKDFGLIALSIFMGALVTTAWKLLGGFFFGGDVHNLIYATLAGQFISTFLVITISFKKGLFFPNLNQLKSLMLKQMVRYRKFPLVDSWGEIVNAASWQLPPLLFAMYYSPSIVGYYALAFRFIQMPMSLIATSVGKAFYPRIVASIRTRKNNNILVGDLFLRLFILGLYPCLLLNLVGVESFSLIFGSQWAESGKYAEILSIWLLFWFVANPLCVVFSAHQKQEKLLFIQILIFLTRLGSIVIGGQRQDIHLSLQLFSVSGLICYSIICISALHLNGVSFLSVLKKILLPLLVAAFLSTGINLFKTLSTSSLMLLTVSGLSLLCYISFFVCIDKALMSLFKRVIFKIKP